MPPDFGPVLAGSPAAGGRHLPEEHDEQGRLSASRQRTAERVGPHPVRTPLSCPDLLAATEGQHSPLSLPEDIHSVITPFLDTTSRLRLSLTCHSERHRFYAHSRELELHVPIPHGHEWGPSRSSVLLLGQLLLRRLKRLSGLTIRGGVEVPAAVVSSSQWTHPLRELRLELGSRTPGPVSDKASLKALGRLLTVLGFREDTTGPVLQVLSLKGCLLDDAHVTAGHLRAFRGLTQLSIASCRVPVEVMQGLLQLLRDNSAPRLEALSLDRTPLEPACLPHLAALLASTSALPRLTSLALSANLLHGERGAEVLQGLASGRRQGLRVLNLGYNDLGEVGGLALSHTLRQGGGALCGLTELRLAYNFLPPAAVASVAAALPFCPGLAHLGLRGNRTLGPGMAALGDVLAMGACPGLQELDLADNGLTQSELDGLLSACRKGACKQLAVLYLDRNAALDCHAAALLAASLEQEGEGPPVLPALRAVHVGASHRIQAPALEALRHRLISLRPGAALL